jgi:multiple sugar transport system substrate-binding protein
VFKASAADVPTDWVAGPTFSQIEADYIDAIGKGTYADATRAVQTKTVTKIKNLGLTVTGQ